MTETHSRRCRRFAVVRTARATSGPSRTRSPVGPRRSSATSLRSGCSGCHGRDRLLEQLGIALLDQIAAAVTPFGLAMAQHLVHERRVGYEREPRRCRVLEDRLLADQLTHVRAVVLDRDDVVAT